MNRHTLSRYPRKQPEPKPEPPARIERKRIFNRKTGEYEWVDVKIYRTPAPPPPDPVPVRRKVLDRGSIEPIIPAPVDRLYRRRKCKPRK